MDVGEHTLELMKRLYSEFTDLRREQLGTGLRLATIEQHLAANQVEIARLSGDVAQIKTDVDLIKRRLDLIDA